jgi:hypothetical protein
MSFQPDLPFFGSESGDQLWQAELAAYRAEFTRRFGVPIGTRVQLALRDFDHPFTGFLEVVAGTTESNPRLRLREFPFDFTLDEITALHRVD